MRILLVGEYSRLHNSLKEGLIHHGHEVLLVGSGDGFKNYPSDYSIEAKISKSKTINFFRKIIWRVFNYDFAELEQGIRFFFLLNKLKGFDVVQLINERPVQTNTNLEIYLLSRLIKQNKKLFLLSCGADYLSVKFLLENKLEKSILNPYFENNNLKPKYQYIFKYTNKRHKKLHNFVYNNCNGIIASDFDYVLPLRFNTKFLGLIPNPVNYKKLKAEDLIINNKIVIFLGINEWNYHQKGINYFEDALSVIKSKFQNRVNVIVAKNLPYQQYINLYNKSHILLDQVFAYDQGYNALEAMAKGKVVFTGAEKEFEEYYQLNEKVAINARPDVEYLVQQLSYLIENPNEIIQIGKNARNFIEREHNHLNISKKYLEMWNEN